MRMIRTSVNERRKLSASVVAAEIGATPRDIENWIGRFEFSTDFEATSRGKARMMTKANTLELAFVAALTAAGVKVSEAVAYAAMYVRQFNAERRGAGKLREWFIFDAESGAHSAIGADELTTAKLAELTRKSNPPVVSVIQAGEIVRRVEALFEAEE
jgi:hypothetical protein